MAEPSTMEQAIAAIPHGWLLSLVQRESDWSATLMHGGTAWQVSDDGADPAMAIQAVSRRVAEGRLYPEFPPELAPAYVGRGRRGRKGG